MNSTIGLECQNISFTINYKLHDLLCELRSRFQQLNCFSDEVIREAFLNALPEGIRTIIYSKNAGLPLEELADTADNLLASNNLKKVMNISDRDQGSNSTNQSMDYVIQRIDKISEEVNKLSLQQRQRKRSYCFYHTKFGKRSYRCQKPCDWVDFSNQSKDRNYQQRSYKYNSENH